MFKVYFQVHGAADIRSHLFHSYPAARMWIDDHSDNLSFSFIQEVFH